MVLQIINNILIIISVNPRVCKKYICYITVVNTTIVGTGVSEI